MNNKIRKNASIILIAAALTGGLAGKFWPNTDTSFAAGQSPTTLAAKEEALPTPAHPLFKKTDTSKVTTVIPETPQANDTDGAPKIMKTDLGLNISPLCFEQLFGIDGPKGPIDVTKCESGSGYKNIKTGIEQGRYRSLYEFPADDDSPAEKGFSSYEYLGDVKAGTAIETYNESGGTGRFSSLILVKLIGNTLSLVDQIAGGDRCNNGLTDAKVENGTLIYSTSVTPGDFPMLAWGQDKGLKSYEDLEASAMSCFGTATFDDGKFSKISLNADAGKQGADWTAQFSKQNCFNKKFKEQIDAGHKDMTAEEFKVFMDAFYEECSH